MHAEPNVSVYRIVHDSSLLRSKIGPGYKTEIPWSKLYVDNRRPFSWECSHKIRPSIAPKSDTSILKIARMTYV